ncbi:MAG TPA: translation initiation factor IF-1 [Candidatus Paceibacterota bacterium]
MISGGRNVVAVNGVVVEALPDTNFKVAMEGGALVQAYLAGKMRLHRIRVLVGDKVGVELDEYGKRGRIVKRL